MNNQMNLENVMLLVGSAVEKCYADNTQNLDFGVFEDIHYELCIQYKIEEIEELDNFERDAESRQAEADAAFYARFGHLGSI
jgi:hypothetical protein